MDEDHDYGSDSDYDYDSDSDYGGHDCPSNPKMVELQDALLDRDPFYIGTCPIPDYQRLLYYTNSGVYRRIDFSNTAPDNLEALYRACNHTEFACNGKSVSGESYHKSRRMDPASFATLLDPCDLGIQEQVSNALLTECYAALETEICELNVYGEGDFFKARKGTLHGQNMFGSLVIVLPTLHEGGQFILRRQEKEWTIDFADKIATATEPSICFIALPDDLEHEVLPITPGYRVTLTYNLYSNLASPTTSVLSPPHLRLRQALADLVNDPLHLPDGGYLVSGLVHEYGQIRNHVIDSLLVQLKGSDRALMDVCGALGLPCSIRLLYRDIFYTRLHFLTTKELDVEDQLDLENQTYEIHLEDALDEFAPEEAEGIAFIEEKRKPRVPDNLQEYFKHPVTKVLEITVTQGSTVGVKSPVMCCEYLGDMDVQYVHGIACLVISVDRASSRRKVVGL